MRARRTPPPIAWLAALLMLGAAPGPAPAFDLGGQAFSVEATVHYLRLLGYAREPAYRLAPDRVERALAAYVVDAGLPAGTLESEAGRDLVLRDLALDWAERRGLAYVESAQRIATRFGVLRVESYLVEASDPHLNARIQRYWLGDRRVLVRPSAFFMCCDVERREEVGHDRLTLSVNARATGCHVHTRRVLIVDGEGAREIESPASAGQTCRIPFPPAER